MATLLDTSVLGRLANPADAFNTLAQNAITTLRQRGEVLYITPQNLIEFRNFATRPTTGNGLGLTATEAAVHAAGFEMDFLLLPDTPDIFPAWVVLVDALGVIGKQVHDARLVAVCHAHAVSHLLTFNVGHFARLAAAPPGVVVVDPAAV
jgi:predicted nucleic acid-binding protein